MRSYNITVVFKTTVCAVQAIDVLTDHFLKFIE